ncbi:lysylphosphatidylglycerol synthase domain-containing protein [Umezawaea sp. Da 62-37]|uniref:lysylphosphatidylglycerol synthase domain-containing protein n=1 Tax=Umezawaea sp. Da 62-37 TaxID=3075927 RepID=UPI0028F73E22|nr:lysylphosphatidylglycerol synthase domain-containing protein [Umezawaea sp. Da 62-37]WNV91573.1 lysylphosphatidylglycerol synthase domain-containing protein [Umezawaea sp. Da 62-37]
MKVQDDLATTDGTAAEVAAPPSSRKATIIAWAKRLLVVLVLAAATYQVVDQWNAVSKTLLSLSWQSIVLSMLAVYAGVWLGPVVWKVVLSDLGAPVRVSEASKFYLVGQLGKYVPGAVWAVLLSMELAKEAGVSRARSFTAGLIATGLGVVASMITGLLALPIILDGDHPELLWLFALLVVGLVFLHPVPLTWLVSTVLKLLRKAPLPHRLNGFAIFKGVVLAVAIYVMFGVHLWLLATSVGAPGLNTLILCAGAMGVSMTAGLMAFFLPSGLGAREAVIVAALATVMPASQALALAVVSRLIFTIADLSSAGVAAGFVWLQGKRGVAPTAPAAD